MSQLKKEVQLNDFHISLILRHLQKELTEDETSELFHWVYSSPEHERIFHGLKDIWQTSQYKQIIDEETTGNEWEAFKKKSNHFLKKQENSRKIYQVIKIAAVIIIALGIGYLTHHLIPAKQELVSVHVPYGAKTDIELPDGSKVWLNSGSQLTYPSNFKGREINMKLNGEAYFQIEHIPRRKVNVQTSGINIRVLGTIFNVKSYEDDKTIETTLIKGSISLSGIIGDKRIEPVILKPKEQATLSKGDNMFLVRQKHENAPQTSAPQTLGSANSKPTLNIYQKVEIEPITGWKDNKLIFRSECFDSLAKKMERWYNVQILIEDDSLKSARYTGSFDDETIEQAIKALSLSLPFNYVIEKNQIKIYKRDNK